jgi:hypothetical protein
MARLRTSAPYVRRVRPPASAETGLIRDARTAGIRRANAATSPKK